MTTRNSARRLCIAALGSGMNLVTAFIAMTFRLPIYMDSTGTILVSTMLGARWGMVTGIVGSLLSGITFDVYSFYYAPVQIFTALMASMVMRTRWGHGWRMLLSGVVVSLPTSLVSAMITAFLFGGQTSSGSSYLVTLLHHSGLSLTVSCFVVQLLTEYLDKLTAMLLARLALRKGGLRRYGTL